MTVDRAQLGWRAPVSVWERFETFVAEKHGAEGPYLRFEMERAMREWLDEDGLAAEAEALLREHTDLGGLSSSTASAVGTTRYQGETRKLNHRINADLKERFAIFADEHDARSYGRALAAALDAYCDGGRARRVLDDVQRLVTGGTATGTTADGVENGGSADSDSLSTADGGGPTGGVDVEPRHVIEIADKLTGTDTFHEQDLERDIAEVAGEADEVVAAYCKPVIEQTGYTQHPGNDELYISEAQRESLDVWDDLTRPERELYLQGFAAAFAVAHNSRRKGLTYRDVQGVIEKYSDDSYSISDQYAYDLMEALGGEPGFEYGRAHGQKQLRVDLDGVDDGVLEWVHDEAPAVDPNDLGYSVDVTSYTAGSAPAQEAVGDD